MSAPLLVIDATYLCHRAFHAMGDLQHGGVGTGVVFGVLKDVVLLQEYFKTTRTVFAFDVGIGKRVSIMPGYKLSRTTRHALAPVEEQEARADFHIQVKKLRTHYLPMAGFKNVFGAKGYEADDIVAQVCANILDDDEAIIIGSDKDLWQCLRRNVRMFNPTSKRAYTREDFKAEWGMHPRKWATIKAYAGCSTDDVKGVHGAGEKTVAKFLRGELPTHHKIYTVLTGSGAALIRDQNLQIVKLPLAGLPPFMIQTDEVTEEKWQEMTKELGMKSLAKELPRCAARKLKGRRR